MGDVIKFPTRSVRGWTEVERALRSMLMQNSASTEMQNHIINRMKDVFQRYGIGISISLELPAGLSSSQQEFITKGLENSFRIQEKKLQELMHQVLFDRLQLEIELYKLKAGSNK